MAKQAVATVSADVPAYLKKMEGAPAKLDDNFDSDDLILPRIALLQGTSDACKSFADAQPGMFWHTGFDSVVVPLKFVIAQRHKRVLLLAPMDDGRGTLARADDALTWGRTGEWEVVLDRKTRRTATWAINDLSVARSGLLEWGTSDPEFPESPPAATIFYDYACIFPERPELGMAVISLARSAIKRAKQGLNDKIALHASNGRPMQSLVFEAQTSVDTNDFGDFYNWRFVSAGFASEEVYVEALNRAEMMKQFKVANEEAIITESDGGSPSPVAGGGGAPSHPGTVAPAPPADDGGDPLDDGIPF